MQNLHYDFSYLNESNMQDLYLKVGEHSYPLKKHTEETLEKYGRENKVISFLLKDKQNPFTHFFNIPRNLLVKNSLNRIQIVGYADKNDPNNYLPPLYHVSYLLHEDTYQSYLNTLSKTIKNPNPRSFSREILRDANYNNPWDFMVDEYNLNSPVETAKYLASQHPMTMSINPLVHQKMMDEHIYPVDKNDEDSVRQCNNILYLAQVIKSQGKPGDNSGFASVKHAKDTNGTPMYFEYDLGVRKKGDAVLIYDLSEETLTAMGPAVSLPVQTSRNDTQFQNLNWNVNQGETSLDTSNQKSAVRLNKYAASNSTSEQWAVSPNTSKNGIRVDSDSIEFNQLDEFSIDVYNNFLRIVGAYIEFYSDPEMKEPLKQDKSTHMFDKFQTDTKTYLAMVSAVNTILGIPMPTDPERLEVSWPKDAQAARLMFAGAGTWNYDPHIIYPGFIQTGIFCFGIPLFMMGLSSAVEDTSWYKDLIKNEKLTLAILGIEAFTIKAELSGLKNALFTFGDIITGMLAKKGLEALTTRLLAKVAADQVTGSMPYVGWVLKALKVALNVAEMAVSLGEILSCPAVIEVDIKRKMKLNFTLHPDPKHGEAGRPETAIWPSMSDNYLIMVNYKNGTGFQKKGNIPLISGAISGTPVKAEFDIPWGGELQIIAAVYSDKGWLCGKYTSEWLKAEPDSYNTGIKSVNGSIIEILVPLTVNTQYTFLQKIVYDKQKGHIWKGKHAGANIPTDTISSLNSGNVGKNLSQLSGITINRSAYVVGYTWRASGINIPLEKGTKPDSGQMYVFQNLSTLENPEKRGKFPSYGFKTKPGLAYDTYGGNEKEIGNFNFVIDTRDAATGYLRHIDLLSENKSFDLDTGLSYGKFLLGNIDAAVVHPNGYVIAVNWASHAMQILQLPEKPLPDDSSPTAIVIGGKGIQQGLLMGPIALAVSPDGKIYILESLNNRVQAFDMNGNPAPSFKGEDLFTIENISLTDKITQELNKKVASQSLIDLFTEKSPQNLFSTDIIKKQMLDAGKLTKEIIQEFADHMIQLSYKADEKGAIIPDPKETSFVTVINKGKQWKITDPSKKIVYSLILKKDIIIVSYEITQTEVIILNEGKTWQLKDLFKANSYLISLEEKKISVADYLPYFPLNPFNEQLNYCDLAIESKGYVYILSYKGDPTSKNIPHTAYVLDVYTPDGAHLFRTPDKKFAQGTEMEYIAAGKITVDLWRDLFSLNYEKIEGPGGRTEPSISKWSPTPPAFTIPLNENNKAVFDSGDVIKIKKLFYDASFQLSGSIKCTTIVKGKHWTVQETGKSYTYDVITTPEGIYVYKL